MVTLIRYENENLKKKYKIEYIDHYNNGNYRICYTDGTKSMTRDVKRMEEILSE